MDPDYKSLLENLMHEMRGINQIVRSTAELLTLALEEGRDRERAPQYAKTIYEAAYLFSSRLDLVDFELNPDAFTLRAKQSKSIYGKFKKAEIGFRRIAYLKKVRVNISGKSFGRIDAFDFLDLLPYLLLDNAVKYAPRESQVFITFDETPTRIEIVVNSIGPALENEHSDRVFEAGWRGVNAHRSGVQGTGRGLHVAKKIVDLHDGKITVQSDGAQMECDGVAYGNFTVRVVLKRHD